MQLETLILSEAQTKIFVMAHDVTETDLHTVIEDFFQNDVHLRKIEDKMKSVFPIFTQEVMRPEVSIKSNNEQSKLKTMKAKKEIYSKMLRRLHFHEMKKTSSNVEEGECYLTNHGINQNGILCTAGSF